MSQVGMFGLIAEFKKRTRPLAAEFKKRAEPLLKSEYFKPGIYFSTVCLLVQRWRGLGIVLSVPALTLVQYIFLQLERSLHGNADLICLDLSHTTDADLSDLEKREKRAAQRMSRIVDACESLKSPNYMPPPWASYTWANLGLYMMKVRLYTNFASVPMQKHTLRMEDGGEVIVHVSSDPSLPQDAPIMIILHTLTGSSREKKQYMKEALKRGWRAVGFDRRGHDSLLRTPSFNLMGEAKDTIKQVELVRKLYPSSFLGMIGVSAGSGLLVNYLGTEGELTPISAAACLCPAYDISQAFQRMAVNFPVVDRAMVKAVKQVFINPNSELLGIHSFESLEMCANAETLDEFWRHHHAFAGCSSPEEYFKEHNPMGWISKVSVPLLVVNSEDDMVCLPENITEDLFKNKYGNCLLLKTKRGSHIAYNEGLLGTGNYLPRLSLDYLEAARRILGDNTNTTDNME